MNYIKLGASLYLPTTRTDLIDIVIENKYPFLRSIILDTEDSVSSDQIEDCYVNISNLLKEMPIDKKNERLLVFIRPRNPEEFKKITFFKNIEKIDGFVLPKFCRENMKDYMSYLPQKMWYMPVLEKNIFSDEEITEIRDFILQYKQNLLSIRIGITDILNILKTRRIKDKTIYEMPVASNIISRIIFAFAPYDINVTGVVYEHFGEEAANVLKLESEKDLQNGLFGKSAIHPSQVQIIQDTYKVAQSEYETASKLLHLESPAVFKFHNNMQECATHVEWAKKIIARKEIYGLC
jgi:citrate lyase beta subunit